MSKKIDRALYGPSWTEVIFGAVLSVALGVLLAAGYLIFKPVTQVKELPKELVPGMVYYIEGSHDSAKARRVASKQKIFLQGGSISVIEDELNIAAMPASPPAAPGKAPAPAPEPTDVLSAGALNFRIHESALQISLPVRVKYALVGLDATFLVQTRGTFAKDGDTFVYVPETVLLGSCPIQRLPMMAGLVMKKFLGSQRFPADAVAAWEKLAEVSLNGATLKLAMPKS
jgi:hypothetical protein